MSDACIRPGCTNNVDTIGVCFSCANSDYKPKSEGVQYRNEKGEYCNTGGLYSAAFNN